MNPTQPTSNQNGFEVQVAEVPKKHHGALYPILIVGSLIVLILIYFFPLASFAARDYAGKLSKQRLNIEDSLDSQIKSNLAKSNKTKKDRNSVNEIKSKYLADKLNRPKLTNLPLAEIVNARYKKAVECKKEVHKYDQKTNLTVEETLKALNYNELFQTASTTASNSVDDGVASTGEKAKSTIISLANSVRDNTNRLENANAPTELFNVHFESIEALQNIDNSLHEYAIAKDSANLKVESEVSSFLNSNVAIIKDLGGEITAYINSLKDKTSQVRSHSTKIEKLEKEILN